jgi:hypothetical protein
MTLSEGAADRAEVEAAFRHYFLTGPVYEDWVAWSRLFTPDAVYTDRFWGTFHGPDEIARFLDGTMSFAPHVYSVLAWYVIDGNRVVYQVMNRADNPEPGGPPIDFPSMQEIRYAGDGRWASENDWWVVNDMKVFNQAYQAQAAAFDPDHRHGMTRLDWGTWVDWARPEPGHRAKPSWLGRGVPPITRLRDIDFGVRLPLPARGRP